MGLAGMKTGTTQLRSCGRGNRWNAHLNCSTGEINIGREAGTSTGQGDGDLVNAAIGIRPTVHETGQIKSQQFCRLAGSICLGNSVQGLARILKFQVRISDGFAHPRRRAGRDIDLINVRIGAGVAHIEITVRCKANVLSGLVEIAGAAIIADRSRFPRGDIDGEKFGGRGCEQSPIGTKSQRRNALAQGGNLSNGAVRLIKFYEHRLIRDAVQNSVGGAISDIINIGPANRANFGKAAGSQVDRAKGIGWLIVAYSENDVGLRRYRDGNNRRQRAHNPN